MSKVSTRLVETTGGAAFARLPADVLQAAGMKEGDAVTVTVVEGRIVVAAAGEDGDLHTPGPWSLGPSDRDGYVSVNSHHHHGLAEVVWKMEGDDRSIQQEANAHLIMAAPDLLAATKMAMAQFLFYEEQHRAKGTPDADAKAQVNRDKALQCSAAIARAKSDA